MKSMKLSEYFRIIRPEYIYLKLTPVKSLRNYNSDKIIKAIASMYRSLAARVGKANKQYFFTVPCKVSYFIYIERENVEFYFIFPKDYLSLLKGKVSDTWKSITVEQVDAIPMFDRDALKYYLVYKKEDALSLATDRRDNLLLSSVLSVLDIMEQGDRIGVFYNFVPASQTAWRSKFDETIEKLKKGMPIDKDKFGVLYAVKLMLTLIINTVDLARESLSLSGKEESKLPYVLSPETLRKRDGLIVRSQVLCLSEAGNAVKAQNNAVSVCEAFKSISGDNDLVYRQTAGKFEPLRLNMRGADSMKISPLEGQSFLALPARELLEEHKCIKHIETLESEVPPELRQGVICLGDNTYKGKTTRAYITDDREYKNLALVVCGPTRAGKTTFISNIVNDTVKAGECTIIFDFCGNCELSADVSKHFPALSIDCSDPSMLQGLGYNEVKPSRDIFIQYRNAKMQTMQLITLIDCLTVDSADLSARMDRYLECAAVVCFVCNLGIKDVFRCLTDHVFRAEVISRVPAGQMANVAEYADGLRELDDEKKGTKYHLISGVLDRVNRLKQNTYLEMMLKKDCSGNFDLLKEIQKPQLICLKMPESMFATEKEKDVYCTYWLTKIWLALQLRKAELPPEQIKKVNIIVDELYQVPSCQDFIRSKLSQMAKFKGKMIISCHYLGQIGIIRNELKAANSSYMLLSGSDKDNFKELKDELAPYEVEDVLTLKRYHSLNLMKYEGGYARFVTRLPGPLK